jgi:hypothetical protein
MISAWIISNWFNLAWGVLFVVCALALWAATFGGSR